MSLLKETKGIQEDKYLIDVPADREIIREYEREFGGQSFEQVLIQKGYLRLTDYYPNGVIDQSKLEEINDLREKHKALMELWKRRDYCEKKEKEEFELIHRDTLDIK